MLNQTKYLNITIIKNKLEISVNFKVEYSHNFQILFFNSLIKTQTKNIFSSYFFLMIRVISFRTVLFELKTNSLFAKIRTTIKCFQCFIFL
jgi:hypothetical protein